MDDRLDALRARLREIDDVESAAAVLEWDQNTYMPTGGSGGRGRQLATLSRLAHGLRTDPALGALLEALRPLEDSLPEDAADRALIRLARREHARAARLPGDFVAALAEHTSAAYVAWTKARPADDFASMVPFLEKTVEMSRQWAGFFPEHDHPADALMDVSDPGTTAATVRHLFADLREVLVPLARAIAERPAPDDAFLHLLYDESAQLDLGREVVSSLGYDFERGRQDLTHHPFMTRLSGGDVRITTRVQDNDLGDAFFSTVHEAGHALYEQNIDTAYDGSPLGHGVSAGVHESQSRLWENLVGRSRPFWDHLYSTVQKRFPAQLGDVPLDAFYRAINRVAPSLIRVDADEVTYNLHVMIRVDLELALLEGKLAPKDLPEAWNARYQADLGVRPSNDREGVLQDVHWYCTTIGGSFQGYTLGNVMSAQFFEAASRAHPEIEARMAQGDVSPLREWLRDNLWCHGARFEPSALVERATGKPLGIEPYAAYLRGKFGPLYGL